MVSECLGREIKHTRNNFKNISPLILFLDANQTDTTKNVLETFKPV
jgi:hypothetical protein